MTKEQNYLGHIVVVDDDAELRSMLTDHLALNNYRVTAFEDGLKAMHYLLSPACEQDGVELVITDLRMPELDGLSLLRQFKPQHPDIPVIIMTAFASVESAIEGLRKGAFDYITKPFKLEEVSHLVEKAVQFCRLKKTTKVLSQEVKKNWILQEMIGKSPSMKGVFDLIVQVAPSNANVLITGESGTGKEVVAKAIHNQSQRARGPFIAINCTAIPETLLESELFGHAKGAFTGANERKKGLFEVANGGTIFLDEIGDMDQGLQAKLLRVLQERKIRPVGENQDKEIDVRVIAATHKDLKKAILNGSFREDLYYRLSVIPIVLPPLRHRQEDIPLLAQHFLSKYSILNGGRVTGFSFEAIQKLMNMNWPGNVRELENMVERMVILAKGSTIQSSDIPNPENQSFENFYGHATEKLPTLEDLEKRYIQLILEKTGGKKEKASQILGINRRTLYRKERDYGFVGLDEAEPQDD